MSKTAERNLAEFAKMDTADAALRELVAAFDDPGFKGVQVFEGEPVFSFRLLSALERAGALFEAQDAKINHPAHYNHGPMLADGTAKYETIKVIEDWGLGFCLGNALKYILRAPHKGTEDADLNKARWYLDRYILCPDYPDRDGPELSMSADSVIEAWSLTDILANTVYYIREKNARCAIMLIDAHIISSKAAAGTTQKENDK